MASMLKKTNPFLTLSFSGGGHLLPYHLGVSAVFLRRARQNEMKSKTSRSEFESKRLPPIKAVAGSSSGAIAAVVHARLPHRVEEFAHTFISEGGRGLEILTSMIHDEEKILSSISPNSFDSTTPKVLQKRAKHPVLHIATTRCTDASLHLFTFTDPTLFNSISSTWTTDKLLQAVSASCTIPRSFHPFDLFFNSSNLSYPEEEGIFIDGFYHIDGGIAAPAPPTQFDENDGAHPIVISPISGDCSYSKSRRRVSPEDDSWRLLPVRNIQCRDGFPVKPSIQNFRALRTASGLTSSHELRDWYERGIEDAHKMTNELLK